MKFYQRVRTKLVLGLLLVALIPMSIMGIYALHVLNDTLHQYAHHKPSETVKRLQSDMEIFLSGVKTDLLFLSELHSLQKYLSLRHSPDSDETSLASQGVEQDFLAFSQTHQSYYQIRYLDELGQERIRVDSNGVTSQIIPKDKLQNKSNRYYFTETIRLFGKQIFVSPLDLNQEHGRIEVPYQPVIRYAVNVYSSDGNKAGIVIVNLLADKFLQPLGNSLLIDQEGYYLHHPQLEKRWGGLRDLKTYHNFSKDHPAWAQIILDRHEGNFMTGQLTLSFQRIFVSSQEHWTLIVVQPTAEIFQSVIAFQTAFGIIFLIAAFSALIVSFFTNRLITQPIEELTEVVKRIQIGERHIRSKAKSVGELGTLEKGLNAMLDAINTSEMALQQAKREAETTSSIKIRFLANMSHELRTPLSAIIGYSEMLQEEMYERNELEASRDLEKIHSAGKHLLNVINDILDISKIEAGRMELFLETFYLPSMINDVIEIVRPLLTKHQHTLEVNLSPNLGEMHTDLTKIRQIILNLLSNASKFKIQGGLILLEVLQPDQEWVLFRIKDHDTDMDEERKTHLLEVFTQFDSSSPLKYGGMELGLAITKHFIHMMEGEITVESQIGEGNTLTVRLPMFIKVSESVSRNSAPVTEPLEEGSIILVVDDDHTVLSILEKYLSILGYQVETADNGEEGLRIARNILPDIIILDVMMPKMDGWEVLARLKADHQLAHVPVIILSMIEDRNIGYSLGAADYLVKPISREQLMTVLEKYHSSEGESSHRLIMLIDDDPTSLDIIGRMLRKARWRVCKAENARIAFNYLQKRQPCLILSDLQMPEMDGFEFISKLHKTYPAIPIIVITVNDLSSEDKLFLKQFNVSTIFQKGTFTRDELLETIHKLIEK